MVKMIEDLRITILDLGSFAITKSAAGGDLKIKDKV